MNSVLLWVCVIGSALVYVAFAIVIAPLAPAAWALKRAIRGLEWVRDGGWA
ncbi:hypothetical protein [Cupriavidus sp. CuC1]|uniref:hypothetical protein n=1 Tax=Cupriavidus sp. CuC1 TaxID=3373131 RepID=UPI0037D73C70